MPVVSDVHIYFLAKKSLQTECQLYMSYFSMSVMKIHTCIVLLKLKFLKQQCQGHIKIPCGAIHVPNDKSLWHNN